MSKPLHAGHAAGSGLRAALLAAQGLTGAERILEGEKGLFRALCPDARPEAVCADARGWKLAETSMKPYPCCRHVHPAIDAALEVRAALGGAAAQRVRVESYPAALDVTDRPDPRTPHQARFSLQYAVAHTLVRGAPGLDAFGARALEDDDVRTMLGRVTVGEGEGLAEAYPERWGARIEVRSVTGHTHRATAVSATGDPDRPLDDPTLAAKVEGLFAWGGLDPQVGAELLEACRALTGDGPGVVLP